MDSILRVGQYLEENARSICEDMVKESVKNIPSSIEVTDEMIELSIQQNMEFFSLLARTFSKSDDEAADELIEWSKKQGEEQAKYLPQLTELIKPYPTSRLMFLRKIYEISMEQGLSTKEVMSINHRVSYLLDTSLVETIISYDKYRNDLMEERQKEINSLSAPIVPIDDELAVLPLIGMIDQTRVQHLINKVLPSIPGKNITTLIIDFSGILTIDEEVARHIFMIHDVLSLLGIKVKFTGIRPNLSLTIVQAGIDFSQFRTFGSVQQAIECINREVNNQQ